MLKAVIFDLDGVIVSTDEYHYRAWKELARFLNLPFTREDNTRQRGVSRMESLEVVLEKSDYPYSDDDKEYLAARKNSIYRNLLEELGPSDILPGAKEFAGTARHKGLKIAIGSSSRNTPVILQKIGLKNFFDAVADGNDITRSKPDPQVFLIAAERIGIAPEECIVIEDADAGIEAAIAAGMKTLAVGAASTNAKADYRAEDLEKIGITEILQ